MEKLLGCYFQVWFPYYRRDLGALKKWQDLKTAQPKELSQYTWSFEECCETPRHFQWYSIAQLGITKIILTDISIWNVDWKGIKSCEPQTWRLIIWGKQSNFSSCNQQSFKIDKISPVSFSALLKWTKDNKISYIINIYNFIKLYRIKIIKYRNYQVFAYVKGLVVVVRFCMHGTPKEL